jgi:hypothetical protein
MARAASGLNTFFDRGKDLSACFSSVRVFIIERPFANHIAGFVQNADFAGNSWIRRDWLRFINALYEVVPDDALRQSFKADAVTFGGQNEVGVSPWRKCTKHRISAD